jgi:hypothetical protein
VSETFTPSDAAYSIFVAWGEMNVHPVAPRRTTALRAADAEARTLAHIPCGILEVAERTRFYAF